MTQSNYLFQLGSTPDLSFAELKSLAPAAERISTNCALAQYANDSEARMVQDLLGGTVKIARVISKHPLLSAEAASAEIVAFLTSLNQEKITFGIGELGRNHMESLDEADIKNALRDAGIKTRYRKGRRDGLSAAILQHQEVTEVLVVNTESYSLLCQTVSVQNIDDWTLRDRSKPYADRKKGMLPPKIARMLITIAQGYLPKNAPKTLLDPFCGTGTVLLEAIMLGWNAYGSDSDATAVEGSRSNIEWLLHQYQKDSTAVVYHADATRVDLPEKVSAIVTEPFLGKQTPQVQRIPNIIRGLEKLYTGAVKHWNTLLIPNGIVVMILPEFVHAKHTPTVQKFIDKLPSLGYTIVSGPISYARPGAHVQRNVYVLRKNAEE